MSASEKLLVAAFLKFLKEKIQSGSLSDDQTESVEVSVQCLENAFGVGSDDYNRLPTNRSIVDILMHSLDSDSTTSQAGSTTSAKASVTDEDKAKAEALKNEGNQLMKDEKFEEALQKYSEAINIYDSAVYFCNRAAAYSKLEQHQKAIDDCKSALKIDPNYSKAYGRMGLAYSCIEKYVDAKDCYQKALNLDPENQSFKNNLQIAEQKLQENAAGAGAQAAGGMGGFSSMFSGGGAGGGMPDLGALLNNPALMNMASQMMSNPEMQNLIGGMMGGGMPGAAGGGAPPPPTGQQGGAAPPGGQAGLAGLMQAGQQLAEQLQQQNPDLVNQLRNQFGGPPGSGTDPNPETGDKKDDQPK